MSDVIKDLRSALDYSQRWAGYAPIAAHVDAALDALVRPCPQCGHVPETHRVYCDLCTDGEVSIFDRLEAAEEALGCSLELSQEGYQHAERHEALKEAWE